MKKIAINLLKSIPAITLICGLSFSSCTKDVGPIIVIDTANVIPVSFANDIQPIFTANCFGGCHDGNIDPNLSAGVAYTSIVDVVSPSYAPYFVVRKFRSDSSSIYHKMNNDNITGGLMPPAGALPASQVTLLKTWIDEGAANN